MPQRPTAPLIAAKQTIPPPRPGAVQRARLHAPLLASASARLTVVVAPAGWGKTTLLSQWAHDAAETRGIVWVSLDESDDNPVQFWTYVLTALQRAVGGLSTAPLTALAAPELEPVDLALPTLLNELAAIDSQHVLVLDDYHRVEHPGIHESLEFLLSYLPPAIRVVIVGRSDPPLPLARLRARGDLTEIRAADLGFSVDEAAALLTAVGDTPVDASTAAVLRDRTEGWAAGLQLAALALRGRGRQPAAATIHGDDRHVLDYFSTEVIDRLPADDRDLLVRMSVLERLSGPLCDHVLDRRGSAAILDRLDRADLFVVPLDARREWYRCHHLFRDVLRHHLDAKDPPEATRLLARAADWYLTRGYVAEAVTHRINAGDEQAAVHLLHSTVPFFLERGSIAEHLQLGQRLSPAIVLSDPRLCVSLAWAAGLSGQFTRIGAWLDAAEPRINDDSPTLEGWRTLRGAALTVRAVELGIVHADAEAALAAAAHGIALESDPTIAGYVVARTVLGAMLTFAGRSADAVPHLDDAWNRARMLALPPLLGLQAASILASALSDTGRDDRLRRLFADVAPAVQNAEEVWGRSAPPGIARLRTVEGRLAHRDGHLDTARTLLRHAVDLARTFGETPALVTALISLADVEFDSHRRTAAQATLREAREVVDNDTVLPLFVDQLEAAERRVGRGSAQAARRSGAMIEELTDREQSVLRALAGNATQREIGAELFLSINTVKGYTKSLYRKLGVVTRADAVREARALDLI